MIVLCGTPDIVRSILLKAVDLNFDNGEYVFFTIDTFSNKNDSRWPWYRAGDTDENNAKAKKAYEMVLTVTAKRPTNKEFVAFSKAVRARAQELYKNFSYGDEVNIYVAAFYDAIILYSLALNETLESNGNMLDGREINRKMWNRTFEGATGTVSIDDNGDRNADYSLLDMEPVSGEYEIVGHYSGNTNIYEPDRDRKIHWAGGRTSPPPDVPKCGFDGSLCKADTPFPEYGIVIIVLGSLLLIVLIIAYFIYRHFRLEAQLAAMSWRIRWEEVMYGMPDKRNSDNRCSRKMSMASSVSGDTIAVHLSDVGSKQLFTKTVFYKGCIVALKALRKTNFTINKPLLMDIKRIKDLQNDHICRFVGACLDVPHQCILSEYCQKGSLQDVLENEQLKLDWMFRYSLVQDIVRGMTYIHNSEIHSHGNLKSTNCVVDGRFVLKITDFGLKGLRDDEDCDNENIFSHYQRKLWTSPELLRLLNRPFEGTQKGDVYSFAIICQEIIYRCGVFYLDNLDFSPKEIYQKVKNGLQPYFRPKLERDDCHSDAFCVIIKRCWNEDPTERPDFAELKASIRKLNKEGDRGNILDNLLSRMEQYANNLEALVDERTSDYLEEKKRAENLLYLMLPKSVAGQLIRGESVPAESYESVTIYFSDICGFTALSAASGPMEVVDLLNDLYSLFDYTIGNYDVYKVETIGDAYMVVSGLPVRNGIRHSGEIAKMSLALLKSVKTFRIRHRPDEQLKLRIGLHSGSVCAGVVGQKMPRYCLFGDTVNTASRMESNGQPLQIHISSQTKALLDQLGHFRVELRGEVEMKGKGRLTTYWLTGAWDENTQENWSV